MLRKPDGERIEKFTTSIDGALRARLHAYAEAHDGSIAKMVRTALTEYLDRREGKDDTAPA